MSLQRPFRLLSRRALSQTKYHPQSIQRRCFATAVDSAEAAELPLAGIRVLDMTRVLAGVSHLTDKVLAYTKFRE